MSSTSTPDQSQFDLGTLKAIERLTYVLAVLSFVAAYFIQPTQPVFLGLFLGAAIGLANFRLIRRLVGKLVQEQANQAKNGIRFAIKILALIACIGFCILVLDVHALAFIVGFSTLVLAILIVGLKSLF